MEAFIKSTDEPQMGRCLEAAKSQTVPFTNIVHINGMVPESAAHNYGMSQITEEWLALIDGDVILYPHAVETALKYMEKYNEEKLYGYSFALYDTFLGHSIGGVSFIRSEPFKQWAIPDTLCNDRRLGRRLRRTGWFNRRFLGEILGTHFDKPDEFQVFRRFFILALKFTGPNVEIARTRLLDLQEITGDPLYSLGVKAIDFGRNNRYYPGSHNIDFDRKMFGEFKDLESLDYASG